MAILFRKFGSIPRQVCKCGSPDSDGENSPIDLLGKVCPFPVVEVVRRVDRMERGQAIRFLVDDPLAIKSVPEELEDYPDLTVSIEKIDAGWEILISSR